MHRIYFDKSYIKFLPEQKGKNKQMAPDKLVARYSGQRNSLMAYIDMLEKSNKYKSVTLYHEDVEQLFLDFCSYFKIVEAGGGIVENKNKDILMIYRRGAWDLPKGKIDPGETESQAAVREVQEETGLQEIDLGEKIGVTRHVYRNRSGKRCIKLSHWYKMNTSEMILKPQAEEDIEKAIWVELKRFTKENKSNTFSNVYRICKKFLKKRK